MKRFAIVCLATASVFASGCSHVARDLRSPGGAIGGVLDNRMFDASNSKELVLLRGAILTAMVARAGTVYSRDHRESEAYVNYLVSAADEINILAGHIYGAEGSGFACPVGPGRPRQDGDWPSAAPAAPLSPVAAPPAAGPATGAEIVDEEDGAEEVGRYPDDQPNAENCFTYTVNFESDVPRLESKMFKVAMAALPQEQAKQFLEHITGGNFMGAVGAAFRFSAKALNGLHSGAAVHRSGLEITARSHAVCSSGRLEAVYDAAQCMGLTTDQLFVGKHDEREDYFEHVNPKAFHALMRNMYDSCRLIPFGSDDEAESLDDLRQERIDLCSRIKFHPRSRWASDAQLAQS